jgi:hypothetical protein
VIAMRLLAGNQASMSYFAADAQVAGGVFYPVGINS